VLPRDEARRVYDEIVSRAKDPGLLEFVGSDLVRSSVFPVPANGTQCVRLTYEHVLEGGHSGGGRMTEYVLPRSEAAVSGGPAWSIGVDVRSSKAIGSIVSPTHEIAVEHPAGDPNRAVVKCVGTMGAGAFRLSVVTPSADEVLASSVFLCPDSDAGDGSGYFMLVAAPTAGDRRATRQREVTLVIDRSGSMGGEKIEQARQAALQVVEGLLAGERFNIIDYSDTIASFAPAPVVKDEASIARARTYLRGIQASGGTNIHDALLEALRPTPDAEALPVVLFLTDGLPTVGTTQEGAIRAAAKRGNAAGRRIFSFGVGFDVNAPLLTGLSRDARGSATFVLPHENVEVKVGQAFRRLSGPTITAPVVTLAGARELMPREMPDVFEGEQIVVLGRYGADVGKTLAIEGKGASGAIKAEVQIDRSQASLRNAFVPRLWASRRVAGLIEQISLAGADGTLKDPKTDPRTKELVDEIVRLSIRWGIMTEYTAFLATEPDARLRAAMNAVPASVPPSDRYGHAAASVAGESLRQRAVQDRSGAGGVNQAMNLGMMQSAAKSRPAETNAQTYLDKDMREVRITSVQSVGDRTLYQRQGRLVDGRVLPSEGEAPERTIEPGTPAYEELATHLRSIQQAGILALNQDVYLWYNNQRVLVKNAE